MNISNKFVDSTMLARIRSTLAALYGERLKGVVFYGSRARLDFDEDSDIDVLVLLDGPVDFCSELRSIVDSLYDLQLELDVAIEAFPVNVETYNSGSWPLYQFANAEGVRI